MTNSLISCIYIFLFFYLSFFHYQHSLYEKLRYTNEIYLRYINGEPQIHETLFDFTFIKGKHTFGNAFHKFRKIMKYTFHICSKFTGEESCRSVISIKLLCNFIEIAIRHGCPPVNLLHIFRTWFPNYTSG